MKFYIKKIHNNNVNLIKKLTKFLKVVVSLFLGDKTSPYYKPGTIDELAQHVVQVRQNFKFCCNT